MDVAKQRQYIIRDTQQDTLKDTTLMLKHEIITEQKRIIQDWKPQSDVCVHNLLILLFKSYATRHMQT